MPRAMKHKKSVYMKKLPVIRGSTPALSKSELRRLGQQAIKQQKAKERP